MTHPINQNENAVLNQNIRGLTLFVLLDSIKLQLSLVTVPEFARNSHVSKINYMTYN